MPPKPKIKNPKNNRGTKANFLRFLRLFLSIFPIKFSYFPKILPAALFSSIFHLKKIFGCGANFSKKGVARITSKSNHHWIK
jgi:hypothetical protein